MDAGMERFTAPAKSLATEETEEVFTAETAEEPDFSS
jgi:hypothetical protein